MFPRFFPRLPPRILDAIIFEPSWLIAFISHTSLRRLPFQDALSSVEKVLKSGFMEAEGMFDGDVAVLSPVEKEEGEEEEVEMCKPPPSTFVGDGFLVVVIVSACCCALSRSGSAAPGDAKAASFPRFMAASTASAMPILVDPSITSGDGADPPIFNSLCLFCCTRRTAFRKRLNPPPSFLRCCPMSEVEKADSDLLCIVLDELGDDGDASGSTMLEDCGEGVLRAPRGG